MAAFVHFTDEKNKGAIIKNGIRRGLFCVPVISDYYAVNQWVREIKQYSSGNIIIAIYFKIPDNEKVLCGKYNAKQIEMPAVMAHKTFLSLEDRMGFQVCINRKILKSEIVKVKYVSQKIGWRHFPKSHERRRCLCPACLTKGSYNSNNIKKVRLKKLFKELRSADFTIKNPAYILGDISNPDLRINGKIKAKYESFIQEISKTANDNIKPALIECMASLYGRQYQNYFFDSIYNEENTSIIETSINSLVKIYGYSILNKIDVIRCNQKTIDIINKYL